MTSLPRRLRTTDNAAELRSTHADENIFEPGKHHDRMRIELHRSNERGATEESWLRSFHSFAFNFWYRHDRAGFGRLRVLNEDTIAAGKGFGMHSHRDMEIVTIVLSGALKHTDSMGNVGIVHAGDVQRMSAGTGVMHAEANASEEEPVYLLQIWVEPKQRGIPPSYEQAAFKIGSGLTVVVDGTQERKVSTALSMHQHAKFSIGTLDAGTITTYEIGSGRGVYVFLISGALTVEETVLGPGDAAAVTGTAAVQLAAKEQSKMLIIEVPMS